MFLSLFYLEANFGAKSTEITINHEKMGFQERKVCDIPRLIESIIAEADFSPSFDYDEEYAEGNEDGDFIADDQFI